MISALSAATFPAAVDGFSSLRQRIPAPALKDLRTALHRAWNDPEFAKEYNRLTGENADPMMGKEIEANLRKIPKDPRVMTTYKQIIGGGPLPPSK